MDNGARERVDAALRWFDGDLRSNGGKEGESETGWADQLLFGGLPFSSQRVALFLRAVIKAPDLVILDEAFSGMDESLRINVSCSSPTARRNLSFLPLPQTSPKFPKSWSLRLIGEERLRSKT